MTIPNHFGYLHSYSYFKKSKGVIKIFIQVYKKDILLQSERYIKASQFRLMTADFKASFKMWILRLTVEL